ncbi:MAG: hypothetical protein KAX40_02010 [Herpetosiphon sp.]|nr:hypothetical protein [Herpetosiphon sp.]
MIERVCRHCQAGNSLDAQTCHACGMALESEQPAPLARRPKSDLAARVRQSPILHSKAAKSLALGVAALAIDVGAALIQKRANKTSQIAPTTTALAPLTDQPRRSMYRRREWQEFDEYGMLRRRVVEHLVVKDE